ncbi:MAG: hypothetical protein OXT65_08720 [Alphaproteobacteria bacterium]|nr:hypothetical protein [Alphaproteobacteria bacterium]
MPRYKNTSYFDQLLDESLKRISKILERELATAISDILSPRGADAGGSIFMPDGIMRGDKSTTVIVNNNAPVGVSVSESQDAMGQKQLEITIDQMVANALVRGRQTTGVLNSLFNVWPGLSGR